VTVFIRRELIQQDSTGGLVIFDDKPNYWDAWGSSNRTFLVRLLDADFRADVEIHHLETRKPLEFSSIRVIAQGPLRASVETQVKYGTSTITATVCGALRVSFSYYTY